jgi:hypothetical protein
MLVESYMESRRAREERQGASNDDSQNNENEEDNMTGRFPLAIAHVAKAAKLSSK